MRRKRKGSGRDVLIDLTSLLDVIFIVLLIVLCGQTYVEENLEARLAETEQAKVRAENEYRLYREQLETAENLNQYVWAVSIRVPYDKDDVTQREIQMLKEGEAIEKFLLSGNNVTESVKAFQRSLEGYVTKYANRPVILSLNENDENILYRDEVMVKEILQELLQKYNNVYLKGSVGEEEQ